MKLFDGVGQITATTGTGTMTLGAVLGTGFFTFAEQGAVDGDKVYYRIDEGGDVEIGLGTLGGALTTLTRDTVLKSRRAGTAGTTKMTLAGAAQVRCVAPSAVLDIGNATDKPTPIGADRVGLWNSVTGLLASVSITALTAAILGAFSNAYALTGSVVQSVVGTYTANTNLTTVIPIDDTIPQSTEGTQIISVTITPRSTTNKLRIRFSGCVSDSTTESIAGALFNGGASAIQCFYGTVTAGYTVQMYMEAPDYVPGTLTPQTISVRVGPQGNTMRMNGASTTRYFGGTLACTLIVEEIKA